MEAQSHYKDHSEIFYFLSYALIVQTEFFCSQVLEIALYLMTLHEMTLWPYREQRTKTVL